MRFNRELYNKADPLSNGIMANWLKKNGYKSIDLKETYGVDITCSKNNEPAFFETEIKYSWVRKWPKEWKEVRIPYRKARLIDKWVRDGSEGTLTFVIFRGDCKQAWFVDGQTVKDSKVEHVDNKYKANEKFYHINVNDAKLIDIEDLDVAEDFNSKRYSEYNNERMPKKESL